ncbi:hypothetical protein GQ607_008895 [Colletotrichum asianum]|uniref:Uncharacterized protein n=1 Tax=Colletotrichum asianum TaxID=702518 RepID=A0A8H3W9P1_9PEZI|nr:hypothetical protein GQ607_008895 [Colletotrichum asianum]
MTVSCHPNETEDVVWRERTDESAPVTLCKLQEKTTLLAVASGSGRENSPGECSSDGMGWDGTDRKKRDESGKGREKKGTGKSRLQSVHAHPGRVDEDPSNVGRRDKDDSPMLVPAAGSPMEMGWHLQESAAVRVRLMLVQSRHTVHNQERPFGRPELQSAAPKSHQLSCRLLLVITNQGPGATILPYLCPQNAVSLPVANWPCRHTHL